MDRELHPQQGRLDRADGLGRQQVFFRGLWLGNRGGPGRDLLNLASTEPAAGSSCSALAEGQWSSTALFRWAPSPGLMPRKPKAQ
jgi:hypothetical protein